MKKKIVYIILILIVIAILTSALTFIGSVDGQLVDAKTGRPIPNTKVQLEVMACLGGQVFNVGGCNPNTIYNEAVVSQENGSFTFPSKVIFKNPIGFIYGRRLAVNEIDKNDLVYSAKLHDLYHRTGPYVDISGGLTGYERLDYSHYYGVTEGKQFSARKISLIPLVQFMTASDCPENMTEIDRRRCLHHVAIREAQPLAAIAELHGYGQSQGIQETIYQYYRTKYFGDCDKPQNYQSGIPTEAGCPDILKVVKENYPICSVITGPILSGSISIKEECEIYHVGSLEKDGKNPLVPILILDQSKCNKYRGSLLELCRRNYEYRNLYQRQFTY